MTSDSNSLIPGPHTALQKQIEHTIALVFCAPRFQQVLTFAVQPRIVSYMRSLLHPEADITNTLDRWIDFQNTPSQISSQSIASIALSQDLSPLLQDTMSDERPHNADVRAMTSLWGNPAEFEGLRIAIVNQKALEVDFWLKDLPCRDRLRDVYYYFIVPSASKVDLLHADLVDPKTLSPQELALRLHECLWSFRGREAMQTFLEAERLCLRFPGHRLIQHIKEVANNRKSGALLLITATLGASFLILFYAGKAFGAVHGSLSWSQLAFCIYSSIISTLVALSYLLVSRPIGLARAIGIKLSKSISSAVVLNFFTVCVGAPLTLIPFHGSGAPPPQMDGGVADVLSDGPRYGGIDPTDQSDAFDVDRSKSGGEESEIDRQPRRCERPHVRCPEDGGQPCVDLNTSIRHCGNCDVDCRNVCQHTSTSSCQRSECICSRDCNAGFADCDGNPANGCEADILSGMENCGECGHPCLDGNSVPGTSVCVAGSCLHGACLDHYANCDSSSDDCETNVLTDPQHCGDCSNRCNESPAHATSQGCDAGRCVLECYRGWDNCDGDPVNGCETNLLNNTRNCGQCGHGCGASALGYQGVCVDGGCGTECARNYRRCNAEQTGPCILMNTNVNCGACGQSCVGPDWRNHVHAECRLSPSGGPSDYMCVSPLCDPGWADCNPSQHVDDGCESRVEVSVSNCGGCGATCANNEICRGEYHGGQPFSARCVPRTDEGRDADVSGNVPAI